MARVYVKKTSPQTVIDDYARLTKEFRIEGSTIVKLNLSWTKYFPSCSTEPWQLEGVLHGLDKNLLKTLSVVENRTVVTDPAKGMKANRWSPVFNKFGLSFTDLSEVKWIEYKPKGQLLALPDIFPRGFSIPEIFLGKSIIHLPTQKTHGHTVITGAVKNAFGGLLKERRHHCHARIHEVLVDLLTLQKEIHKNVFCFMDGTVCGDGAGPRTMRPHIKNYILASDDPVAIDTVSSTMMGFEPGTIPFIRLAHEHGVGCGDFSQIEIVGEDIRGIDYNFSVGRSPVIFFDQFFRRGMGRILEPLIFRTPLFLLPVFASEVYHDYLWYPLVGKRLIGEFMKTEWGKLFSSYG